MNIYNYDWWEVLIFLILLELACILMAYILMSVWTGKYSKGGSSGRRKKGVFMHGRKRTD
ncbi:hypothetical protein AAE02nite_48450 [Adhaeribacter aerolatus]|uniref:Uncharacterized protein n=1 Tax=Adhaeribacter aerolatus TaxID=670289 RepID=A0A512B5G2_9BACT|nr:hypothetical protein [Adhaeribacter aerolatus]GEO07181.1 hypothetical protein AAE02nite_48450 [Adhaeribacter aerolatus]